MKSLYKVLGMGLIIASMMPLCSAAITATPEIDPASAGTVLTLLGGIVMTIRSRSKR